MSAVLRAAFGYLFLVFIIRIESRRPGRQMTPFDYLLIFYVGGLTLTTLVGADHSMTNALSIIIGIAVTHYGIAWLKQVSPAAGRVIDGTPMVLLEQGKWDVETMKKMRMQQADVMAAARDHAVGSLDDIDYAILERNGEISIIAKEGE